MIRDNDREKTAHAVVSRQRLSERSCADPFIRAPADVCGSAPESLEAAIGPLPDDGIDERLVARVGLRAIKARARRARSTAATAATACGAPASRTRQLEHNDHNNAAGHEQKGQDRIHERV